MNDPVAVGIAADEELGVIEATDACLHRARDVERHLLVEVAPPAMDYAIRVHVDSHHATEVVNPIHRGDHALKIQGVESAALVLNESMLYRVGVEVQARNLADVVVALRRIQDGALDVNKRVVGLAVVAAFDREAMLHPVAVNEGPHRLWPRCAVDIAVIDPVQRGKDRTLGIESNKLSILGPEAVLDSVCIEVKTYCLSLVVQSPKLSVSGRGIVNGGELPVNPRKAVRAPEVVKVVTGNIALSVDRIADGIRGPGEIDRFNGYGGLRRYGKNGNCTASEKKYSESFSPHGNLLLVSRFRAQNVRAGVMRKSSRIIGCLAGVELGAGLVRGGAFGTPAGLSLVISRIEFLSCHSEAFMPRTHQSGAKPRPSRAKLGGSVLALVLLPNRRQLRVRMHQLSITGGVLHVTQPLDEGVLVEIAFHVGSATVRTQAQMMFPMWATQGCLQPFRFKDMAEEDRARLEKSLQSLVEPPAAAASAANSGTL